MIRGLDQRFAGPQGEAVRQQLVGLGELCRVADRISARAAATASSKRSASTDPGCSSRRYPPGTVRRTGPVDHSGGRSARRSWAICVWRALVGLAGWAFPQITSARVSAADRRAAAGDQHREDQARDRATDRDRRAVDSDLQRAEDAHPARVDASRGLRGPRRARPCSRDLPAAQQCAVSADPHRHGLMEPTTLLPAIACSRSSPSNQAGGRCSASSPLVAAHSTPHTTQAFRAGHAHAGVLLVLAVAAAVRSSRPRSSTEWVLGSLLLAGILAQSGGFFLLVPGSRSARSGRGSPEPAPSSSPFRSRGLPLAC